MDESLTPPPVPTMRSHAGDYGIRAELLAPPTPRLGRARDTCPTGESPGVRARRGSKQSKQPTNSPPVYSRESLASLYGGPFRIVSMQTWLTLQARYLKQKQKQ